MASLRIWLGLVSTSVALGWGGTACSSESSPASSSTGGVAGAAGGAAGATGGTAGTSGGTTGTGGVPDAGADVADSQSGTDASSDADAEPDATDAAQVDAGLDAAADSGTASPCADPTTPPLLFTTLDDSAATVTPALGAGSGVLTGGTFVPAKCDTGLQLSGVEGVTYPSLVGTTYNIQKSKGSIQFWYKPNHPGTDGKSHYLFESGISLHFAAFASESRFHFYAWVNSGSKLVQVHTSANDAWFQNDFVHLGFFWDFAGGALWIKVNGATQGSSSVLTGDIPGYIGSITVGTKQTTRSADGVFDQFRIFP